MKIFYHIPYRGDNRPKSGLFLDSIKKINFIKL